MKQKTKSPEADIPLLTAEELAKSPELAAAIRERFFRCLIANRASLPIAPDPEPGHEE